MHYNAIIRMDFMDNEEHVATARRVQQRMLELDLPVPAISEVMLGLTRGRYIEYLDAETKKS